MTAADQTPAAEPQWVNAKFRTEYADCACGGWDRYHLVTQWVTDDGIVQNVIRHLDRQHHMRGCPERPSTDIRTQTPATHTSAVPAIDAAHLTRQRTFSLATFGPGARPAGVIDHIRKELAEIEAAPTDLGEWVDVAILAFDGALRAGHEPQAIIDAVLAKQARNEARTWPDWRTADPDKAIEHDRTNESARDVG